MSELYPHWSLFCLTRNGYKQPLSMANVHWVQADLAQPWMQNELPSQIDAVIHLAQSEHFRQFPDKAVDIFHVNAMSTLQLLEYARQAGAKSFVLASSGGVYGYHEQGFSEDEAVTARADLGFYLSTKLCAEIIAENYAPFMNIIILRFFFVYGPGQRKSMLVPRLIQSVREGRTITLQGEDGIRINPTCVADAARAIAKALTLEQSHKINVGGPDVLSLRQIGEMIGQAVGRPPIFQIEPESQPRHLVGDIRKMTELLGAPQMHFTEGLHSLLAQEQ